MCVLYISIQSSLKKINCALNFCLLALFVFPLAIQYTESSYLKLKNKIVSVCRRNRGITGKRKNK